MMNEDQVSAPQEDQEIIQNIESHMVTLGMPFKDYGRYGRGGGDFSEIGCPFISGTHRFDTIYNYFAASFGF